MYDTLLHFGLVGCEAGWGGGADQQQGYDWGKAIFEYREYVS